MSYVGVQALNAVAYAGVVVGLFCLFGVGLAVYLIYKEFKK